MDRQGKCSSAGIDQSLLLYPGSRHIRDHRKPDGDLLLVYKGREPVDFYLSALAGIFAICLLLFPTSNIHLPGELKYSVTTLIDDRPRILFHYISAGIFLSCLAGLSFFVFTKSDKKEEKRTPEKKIRNRIYRVCAVLMMTAIVIIFLNFLNIIPDDVFDRYHITFWMETLAVESFGVSWLVKGEMILKDGR